MAGSDSENDDVGRASSVYDLCSKRRLITAYLGPEVTAEEIRALIDWKKTEIAEAGCTVAYVGDDEELSKRAAQAIGDGKIVGWFQGRMAWGPRPLGDRSILCDPRQAEVKDVLNGQN